VGEVVDGSHYIAPRAYLMDPATRALFVQAQASDNLVALIGGIHWPVNGGAADIFIFRT
jgi:hypothetical protein